MSKTNGKNRYVRLEALRFTNIKNVHHGEIYFPEQKKLERGELDNDSFSSVLGLYGQNRSGKTTTLNALRVIQALLGGNPVPPQVRDFVSVNHKTLSIEADFLVNKNNRRYYVYYSIEFEKDNLEFKITKEKLSYFKNGESKQNFYSFSAPETINERFLESLSSKDRVIYPYICGTDSVSKTSNAPQSLLSTIFNRKLLSIVLKNRNEKNDDFATIVYELFIFGNSKLAIYDIDYFNENPQVGIRFRVKTENEKNIDLENCGDIFVPFTLTQLPKKLFVVFEKVVKQINSVIPTIIPGYKLIINEVKMTNPAIVTDAVSFELLSQMNSETPIPLIFESNGVKKILSILSGLIDAFNHEGCLIAIDELDSGIFEYLLGELVSAFENFGQGQLIFTSHNLRALEKLNPDNIFFTTTDRDDVFIKIKGVKETNNLRDLYYRYIANGYEGKSFFDAINISKLINAFESNGD